MIRHAFNRVEEESNIGVFGLSVVFEKFSYYYEGRSNCFWACSVILGSRQ